MADMKVIKCDCRHDYQDRKYGKGLRIHNKKIPKTGSAAEWRCTVCKKEKP